MLPHINFVFVLYIATVIYKTMELVDIGDKIDHLTRTAIASTILDNIPHWDEGGCGLFAQALFPIIKFIDTETQIYTIIRADSSIDHFLLYLPSYGKYLDSNGWNWYKPEFAGKEIRLWDGTLPDVFTMCDSNKIDLIRKFITKYLMIPFVIINDDGNQLWHRINNNYYLDGTLHSGDVPEIVIDHLEDGRSWYLEIE